MLDVITLAIMGVIGVGLAVLAVWGDADRDRQHRLDGWYADRETRR